MTDWSVIEPVMTTLPRRRKEARPAELLDAALAVFAEKGFTAARMEDIAARAGAAKGTLYLYFPSKEAVFEALVRTLIVPNLDRAEALVAGHPGPAAATLRELLLALAAVVRDPRVVVLPRLLIGELHKFPDLARFYKASVVDRGLALFAGVHRRGVAAGEFRPQDSEAVARLVIAPLLLLAVWRAVFAPHEAAPFDPDRVLQAHIATLLRGLAA